MAKKQATGPTLTQRERRSQAAASAAAASSAATSTSSVSTEEQIKTRNTVEVPAAPSTLFIGWLNVNFGSSLTTDKIIQLSILVYAVHSAYLKFYPTYSLSETDVNLITSSLCGVLAHFIGIIALFKSKSTQSETVTPSWNTIYLIFLPAMFGFVLNKDLMLFNVAFSMTSLDLPIIAKIFIQMCTICSNIDQGREPILVLKIVVSHLLLNHALGRISEFKSWDRVENNLFSILIVDLFLIDSDKIYIVLLQKLLISLGASIVVVYGVSLVYKSNDLIRSFLLSSSWFGTFIAGSLYQLDPIFDGDCLNWLYQYVFATETRKQILSIWLGSLLLLIPTIFSYKIQLSPNFRRKIWHFLILLLLVYPLYLDQEFVKLSLSGALVLFFCVEVIRYLKLYPIGDFLDSHLREFADYRDEKGPIIISYIYLIIGITVPILINGNVIGLVVLGVGDSLASIIGTNYGEIRWAHSNKTIEGTLTFIVATYAVASLLKYLGWFFLGSTYHDLLLTSTLSGVLEGNSDLNDNILIPAYMSVLLEVL